MSIGANTPGNVVAACSTKDFLGQVGPGLLVAIQQRTSAMLPLATMQPATQPADSQGDFDQAIDTVLISDTSTTDSVNSTSNTKKNNAIAIPPITPPTITNHFPIIPSTPGKTDQTFSGKSLSGLAEI